MQNAPLGAFCNIFDLHEAIISLDCIDYLIVLIPDICTLTYFENQFSIFLIVAVLHRFYCNLKLI